MGWLYVEIERLSSHELLCAVCFHMFVYVYDVLCMRGDFAHLRYLIGIWLAFSVPCYFRLAISGMRHAILKFWAGLGAVPALFLLPTTPAHCRGWSG